MEVAAYREILIGDQFNKSHSRRRFVKWIERGIHRRKPVGRETVFGAKDDLAIGFDGAGESFVAVRMIGIRAGKNNIKHDGPGPVGGQPFDQLRVNAAVPRTIVRLL